MVQLASLTLSSFFSGKNASYRSIKKIASERMDNSKKVTELMVNGIEELLNGINQVTTTNIENDIKD